MALTTCVTALFDFRTSCTQDKEKHKAAKKLRAVALLATFAFECLAIIAMVTLISLSLTGRFPLGDRVTFGLVGALPVSILGGFVGLVAWVNLFSYKN